MEVRRYRSALAALALFYLLLEAAYVVRLPLVTDEFDGAYDAYRLRHDVPYRDYTPYKTVGGYYIQMLASFLASDVWSRILAIKLTLVVINAAMLVWATVALQRFVAWRPALAALGLLVVNSNFLERSAELRVDMLTGWAGLASLVFLLQRRFVPAGIACAASFLISQKGALYFVAALAGLAAAWALERSAVNGIRSLAVFSAAFGATIAAYVAFWSAIASLRQVVTPTFRAAAGQALMTFYDIRGVYWKQIALRNPLWIVLPVIAAAVLLRRRQHVLIAAYSVVLLAEAIAYTQPWPYFFPLIWPTFFVLFAFFFAAVPIPRWPAFAIAAAGVLLPLTRIPVVLQRDNGYQRYNVAIASAMLEPHDTYIAGTDIVHDREQTLPRLERLDAYMLTLLSREPPVVLEKIAQDISRRPPKLLIGTYRLYQMPERLQTWFYANYVRLTASIVAYAPLFDSGTTNRVLSFGGRYRIDTQKPEVVSIDGVQHRTGDVVTLAAGSHTVGAQQQVRLRLVPESVEAMLNPAYLEEQPFYVDPYGY